MTATMAVRMLRQALQQHSRTGTQLRPHIGVPGHLLQAALISLQTRQLWCAQPQHLPYTCHLDGPRHQYRSHLSHHRGFAEQSTATVAVGSNSAHGKPEDTLVKASKTPAGPMSHMRTGMIKAVFLSPNVLMEPYRGPGVKLSFLQSWFSMTGWHARKERVMSNMKSMYAIAKLKRNVKPFSLKLFKGDALKVYEETCQLLAEGDQSRLRQATTPGLFADMKREIKARQDGGWKTVRWSMRKRPELHMLDIVHGRIMAQNPKDDKSAWVQLTLRIPSEQSFAAYDSSKTLVAGDPDKAIKVYDTWVFERALKKDPSTRWRCAGRLSIPSPADLKQAATTQQAVAGTAATPPQAVATAATGTAAKPQQMSKPTVVSEPEQVRRKGKKRMRVAAAA